MPRSILRQRSLQKGKSSSSTRTSIPQVGQWSNFADFFFEAMEYAAAYAVVIEYRSAAGRE